MSKVVIGMGGCVQGFSVVTSVILVGVNWIKSPYIGRQGILSWIRRTARPLLILSVRDMRP